MHTDTTSKTMIKLSISDGSPPAVTDLNGVPLSAAAMTSAAQQITAASNSGTADDHDRARALYLRRTDPDRWCAEYSRDQRKRYLRLPPGDDAPFIVLSSWVPGDVSRDAEILGFLIRATPVDTDRSSYRVVLAALVGVFGVPRELPGTAEVLSWLVRHTPPVADCGVEQVITVAEIEEGLRFDFLCCGDPDRFNDAVKRLTAAGYVTYSGDGRAATYRVDMRRVEALFRALYGPTKPADTQSRPLRRRSRSRRSPHMAWDSVPASSGSTTSAVPVTN